MPEFDVLMSPAVSQLTTDPLVELNGITYVVCINTVRLIQLIVIFMYIHCMYVCMYGSMVFIATCRATTIYTTQALVCNSTVSQCSSVNDLVDIDVMLVGTNDGKVLKIVMTYNGTDHVPLISEELSVSLYCNMY